ncbi:MAG: glycosyltransferase family 4 protein [Clostridiales bacterium]|nr:glycosyltransferase family 4 protein [Clostridiales bacterium]
MKILFMTNVPSPYRVDFFNELGKHCDLTVTFEKKSSDERGSAWDGYKFDNFKGVFLKGRSINTDTAVCFGIIKYLNDKSFDRIICADFLSPTGMLAIEYMRIHRIPYLLESDGGTAKNGKGLLEKIKKHFISGAFGYFSTAKTHDDYYKAYGAKEEKIYRYNFTSLKGEDILQKPLNSDEKDTLKQQLGIKEKRCIVSVGRFSYLEGRGKGFDTLVEVAKKLDNSIGVYIIADEPTEEFKKMKEDGGEMLNNLHFIGFKKKNELFQYYKAADIFVLLTLGEAWGLVINEAMANGLPVITTTKCVAGTELVQDGVNGYLVEPGNSAVVVEKVNQILCYSDVMSDMEANSLDTISSYTIENMAEMHMQIVETIGH